MKYLIFPLLISSQLFCADIEKSNKQQKGILLESTLLGFGMVTGKYLQGDLPTILYISSFSAVASFLCFQRAYALNNLSKMRRENTNNQSPENKKFKI